MDDSQFNMEQIIGRWFREADDTYTQIIGYVVGGYMTVNTGSPGARFILSAALLKNTPLYATKGEVAGE
jgi:hypothetical protein